MNKPSYLMPFVYIYKVFKTVWLIVSKFIKFFSVGVFAVLTTIINIFVTTVMYFFRWIFIGYGYICYLVFRFIRYFFVGIGAIFGIFFGLFAKLGTYFKKVSLENQKIKEKKALESEKRAIAREHNKKIEEENKKRLEEKRKLEKEQHDLEKKQQKERTKAEVYINENVTFEKQSFANKIDGFFAGFGNFFKKEGAQKDINREALLLDLEGADAEKSENKIMYRYVAKTEDGRLERGTFAAYSKVEVHSFLLSENKEVYSIETNKWVQALYGDGSKANTKKIKISDLIFFITQLSTYIKAGITLVEALKILSGQFKNPRYKQIFRNMIYDLSTGDNFSDAMLKQGNAFPRLLINMIKASEMTGELPEALDDMTEYYTETEKTRKQMITALTYPSIVFIFAIGALVFVMVFVVPNFVELYEGLDGVELPGITLAVLNISNFLQSSYIILILSIIAIIGLFIFLMKKVKAFKVLVQWINMHIPILGEIIIYNEVTMFTKTFASLLAHNVFITDSMDILNKITNNEIYRALILDTIANLAKGDKISLAYKDHWAFPIPAYEMIRTGEQTGQLPEMMGKVAAYYQELHHNSVARIKALVEPVLIIFLTAMVGVIVLSIITPMFDVYGNLGL